VPVPYISIVTPVLNSVQTLARTIQSVSTQKASFEHVIYDSGSTDGSRELVERHLGNYALRVINGTRNGLYNGVASAHRETTGDVMGWINADDYYQSHALAIVERVFREMPEVQWLTGVPSRYWEGQQLWSIPGMAPIYSQRLIELGFYRSNMLGCLQQESMFWRRSLYLEAHGEAVLRRYELAADFHLWRAFARRAPLRTVRTVLATFTIRPGQVSQVRRLDYDQECGVRQNAPDMSRYGRAFNRLYSNAFRKRSIYPEQFAVGAK
jgi:glycosyltransferase involved in cell wall biosynthesis